MLTVLLALPALVCCGTAKDTVMTLGSFEVSYDHYRYIYMNILTELEETEKDGQEREKELESAVMDSLRYSASVYELAREKKVSLSEDEQTEITELVSSAAQEYGGDAEFETALREEYLTRDFFRRGLELQYLEQKLRTSLSDEYGGELAVSDEQLIADAKENFYYAEYILTEDEQDAEEVLAKAREGVPLSELAEGGRTLGSYCFTRGQLVQSLEDAVLAVGEGEVVDEVIVASDGCRVVRRLTLSDELIDKNFDSIREAYLARRFGELRSEVEAGLEEKRMPLFDTLSPEKLASPWSEVSG